MSARRDAICEPDGVKQRATRCCRSFVRAGLGPAVHIAFRILGIAEWIAGSSAASPIISIADAMGFARRLNPSYGSAGRLGDERTDSRIHNPHVTRLWRGPAMPSEERDVRGSGAGRWLDQAPPEIVWTQTTWLLEASPEQL
jgi:hypothetical protein